MEPTELLVIEAIAVTVAVALGMLLYDAAWTLIDAAKRSWHDRPGADEVDRPALAGEGPAGVEPKWPSSRQQTPEPFVPPTPHEIDAWRDARWWISATGTVHLAGCPRLSGNAQPWPWPDTVARARLMAAEEGWRECRTCEPLNDHEAADEPVAAS